MPSPPPWATAMRKRHVFAEVDGHPAPETLVHTGEIKTVFTQRYFACVVVDEQAEMVADGAKRAGFAGG